MHFLCSHSECLTEKSSLSYYLLKLALVGPLPDWTGTLIDRIPANVAVQNLEIHFLNKLNRAPKAHKWQNYRLKLGTFFGCEGLNNFRVQNLAGSMADSVLDGESRSVSIPLCVRLDLRRAKAQPESEKTPPTLRQISRYSETMLRWKKAKKKVRIKCGLGAKMLGIPHKKKSLIWSEKLTSV